MPVRLALVVLALAALVVETAAAQSPPVYYCEPLNVYSPPAIVACPAPWRVVNPASVASQPSRSAEPAPPQAPAAAVAPPSFVARDDGLDEFCKTAISSRSIALCSDKELRTLAIERQHAFDEARSRLSPDRQKELLADQNGWVKSYSTACGVAQDVAPSLPLASAIKDCMAQAGRARIAYLRTYGGPTRTVAVDAPKASVPAPEDHPSWPGGIYLDKPPPKAETREGDMAFKAQIDEACGDSATDHWHFCSQLSNNEPPCIAYRNFAWIYYNMAGLPAGDVGNQTYELAQHIRAQMTGFRDEFIRALEPLLDIAYHARKWPNADAFKDDAYDHCMASKIFNVTRTKNESSQAAFPPAGFGVNKLERYPV